MLPQYETPSNLQQLLLLVQQLSGIVSPQASAVLGVAMAVATVLQSQGRDTLTAEEMEQITNARHSAVNKFLGLTQ